MKRLNLDGYSISVKDSQGLVKFVDYEVKSTIINILTHPQFGLNGPDMMDIAPLVKKIDTAAIDVILTNEEYQVIIGSLKRFKGFIKNDIPMLERVYNCPDNAANGENIAKFSKN